MTLPEISHIRLVNQQLVGTDFKTPEQIVSWMGAMQAQDYAMSKWAVGVRLPNSTDKLIQEALDKGAIIRTHVLRPTWHLVSADDIYWMLELSGPRVKAFIQPRIKFLEITEQLFSKSNAIIEKALSANNHSTREEIIAKLNEANIITDDLRGLHFLMRAELEGLICSGITRNKNQTYALLSERVAKTASLNKDEALAKLAKKYFLSHGPATLADFTWWSGLSASEAKHALEMIKSDLVSDTIEKQTFWMNNSVSTFDDKRSTYLLPAFDEFLISYKDRSASIPLHHQSRAFTNNGIFKPVIVENGQVTGIWKRTIQKDKVIIETDYFKPQNEASKKQVQKAAGRFGKFLNKQITFL